METSILLIGCNHIPVLKKEGRCDLVLVIVFISLNVFNHVKPLTVMLLVTL